MRAASTVSYVKTTILLLTTIVLTFESCVAAEGTISHPDATVAPSDRVKAVSNWNVPVLVMDLRVASLKSDNLGVQLLYHTRVDLSALK